MSDKCILKIDEKWSVSYDPSNNDKPLFWIRYGEHWHRFEGHNAVTAMFYALLAKEAKPQEVTIDIHPFGEINDKGDVK